MLLILNEVEREALLNCLDQVLGIMEPVFHLDAVDETMVSEIAETLREVSARDE